MRRMRGGLRGKAFRIDGSCKVPCDGGKGTGAGSTADGFTLEDLGNGTWVNVGIYGDGA